MFTKKKKEPEQPKEQEKTETEQLNVGPKQEEKKQTIEEVISERSEAWYKAQVLIMLGEILQTLQEIKEMNKQE